MKERVILAILCRGRSKRQIWQNRYSTVDRAMSRLQYHMIRTCKPGDVFELSSVLTGKQLGTISMGVNRSIKSRCVWDEEYNPSIKIKE